MSVQNKVQVIPNPIGIDLEIQNIQSKLSRLDWLEVCFGRCIKQISTHQSKDKKNHRLVYPEVYFRLEPINVMPNDAFKSYCFFHTVDPLSFVSYDVYGISIPVSQPIEIIFWFNMKKINNTKKYNFAEELRFDVLGILKTCSSLIISEIYSEFDNIFEPFTIQGNFEEYLKYPYGGFKIAGTLNYNFFNCKVF